MSRLADIPIKIENAAATFGLGGGVTAILAELATLLDRFAADRQPATIDLRSLPMSPQDRSALQRALGEGEVHATFEAEGVSTVRETSIAGLWWIEHRNQDGELIAELLEVARVPEILSRAHDEIAAGGHALRQRIAAASHHPHENRQ